MYLGLDVGEVFYGNIGSKDRLDFTVVGPAVNEVSRITAMCRSVDQPMLVSAAFAASAADERRFVSVGRYALRGIGRPRSSSPWTVSDDPSEDTFDCILTHRFHSRVGVVREDPALLRHSRTATDDRPRPPERPFEVSPMNRRYAAECGRRRNGEIAPIPLKKPSSITDGKLDVFWRRVGRVLWAAPGPPSRALCGQHYRKPIDRS